MYFAYSWHLRLRSRTLLVSVLGTLLFSPGVAQAASSCGIPACRANGLQRYPLSVSDGAGGSLVLWEDERSADLDLYLHHVLASGILDPGLPVDGIALTTAVGDQFGARMVSDGAGGAFVVWQSWPTGDPTLSGICAHHILSNGMPDPSWPVNGRSVTIPDDHYVPDITTDGAGGAIVGWHDFGDATTLSEIYVGHVLSNGALDVSWPAAGVHINASNLNDHFPALVSDGAGGTIVAWSTQGQGVYATRVLATGTIDPAWPVNGRHLTTTAADADRPRMLQTTAPTTAVVVFDNFDAGGGFSGQNNLVAASVTRFSPSPTTTTRAAAKFTVSGGTCTLSSITLPILLQSFGSPTTNILRVRLTEDAGGTPGTTLEVLSENQAIWPPFANPFTTTTTLTSTLHPTLTQGGSYWIVTEPTTIPSGTASSFDVNYRWFDNTSGTLVSARQQSASGVLVTDPWSGFSGTGNLAFRVNGEISLPSVGAIVTWQDFRQGASNGDIYAQGIRSDGAIDPSWPVNGLAVCDTAGGQSKPQIVSDGGNGAIVTWEDARYGTSDIFAHHVQGGGMIDPAWPTRGRALCLATGAQSVPQLVSDSEGGALVTWQDHRNNIADVYAQRVRAGGAVDPAWPGDGLGVCTNPFTQLSPTLATDGNHGAIIAWWDNRDLNTTAHDIYVSRVYSNGGVAAVTPSDARPGLRFTAFPNPAGAGELAIRMEVPASQYVTVTVLDLAGRSVRTLADRLFEAGSQRLVWNGRDDRGTPVANGIYFIRAHGAVGSHTERVVLLAVKE